MDKLLILREYGMPIMWVMSLAFNVITKLIFKTKFFLYA